MENFEKRFEGCSTQFIESYKDCHDIAEIEGKTVEGEWSGYSFRAFGSDTTYFTYEGIRGMSRGKFNIKDGRPVEVVEDYRKLTLTVGEWQQVYDALDDNDPKLKEIKGYIKHIIH